MIFTVATVRSTGIDVIEPFKADAVNERVKEAERRFPGRDSLAVKEGDDCCKGWDSSA